MGVARSGRGHDDRVFVSPGVWAMNQSTLQRCLDWFYFKRKWVLDTITYYSIRLYGIEDRTFEEVELATSLKRQHKLCDLGDAKDLDGLLNAAKDSFKSAVERRGIVTDKCKTLLTVSS